MSIIFRQLSILLLLQICSNVKCQYNNNPYDPNRYNPNNQWNNNQQQPNQVNRRDQGGYKSPSDPISRFHHSDSRCREDLLTINPEEYVHVTTKYGKVTGRHVFLCDTPGTSERDRPGITYPSPAAHRFPPSHPSSSFNPGSSFQFRARVRSNVTAFLGIPYARAPTKENGLRFKAPRDPDHFGSMEAITFGPSCPQPLTAGGPINTGPQQVGFGGGVFMERERMNQQKSAAGNKWNIERIHEDCLYLNVFSPYVSGPVGGPGFPVLVHIHGGNYDSGSGNAFPGHLLSASQQIVVVTFNYRLGLLGYFATADNASAGNFGLLDQIQAVRWVRENIRSFNGNPDSITLYGAGDAGAASAGLMAMSPLSRHMVKRVIAPGGAAVAPWALHRTHTLIKNNSLVAAFKYGCRTWNSVKLLECLSTRSYSDFTGEPVIPDVGWLAWAPVPDFATRPPGGQVLPFLPEDVLSASGSGFPFPSDFSYLTGVARDAASSTLLQDPNLVSKGFVVDAGMFEDQVQNFVRIMNGTLNQDGFKSALKFMYSPFTDPGNESLVRDGLVDMLTDAWFVSGIDKQTKLLLRNNVKTFMYVLNYTLEGVDWPEWRAVPAELDSLLLTSGAPFMDSKFYGPGAKSLYNLDVARWTESDRNMSQFFMEFTGNFVKFGNPTPSAAFNTILWKEMNLKTLQFLSVNTTNYTSIMHRDYRQKYAQFWNDYLPSLTMNVAPTWPPTYEPMEVELRVYRAATWAVVSALLLLLFLTLLCSCLYCRAKRDRWGDAAIDDYLPNLENLSTTQYSAPSTRANSESSLRSLSRSRDRVDFTPLKPVHTSSRSTNLPPPSDSRFRGVTQKLQEMPRSGSRASNLSTSRASSRDGLDNNSSAAHALNGSTSRSQMMYQSSDQSSRTNGHVDGDVNGGGGQRMVTRSLKGSPKLRHKVLPTGNEAASGNRNGTGGRGNGASLARKDIPGLNPPTKFSYAAYH